MQISQRATHSQTQPPAGQASPPAALLSARPPPCTAHKCTFTPCSQAEQPPSVSRPPGCSACSPTRRVFAGERRRRITCTAPCSGPTLQLQPPGLQKPSPYSSGVGTKSRGWRRQERDTRGGRNGLRGQGRLAGSPSAILRPQQLTTGQRVAAYSMHTTSKGDQPNRCKTQALQGLQRSRPGWRAESGPDSKSQEATPPPPCPPPSPAPTMQLLPCGLCHCTHHTKRSPDVQ